MNTADFLSRLSRRLKSPLRFSGICTPQAFPQSLRLTVAEASRLTGFPEKFWFSLIRKKLLPATAVGLDRAGLFTPEKLPQNISLTDLAAVTYISADALPPYARFDFYSEQIVRGSSFSVDFVGYLARYGPDAFEKLLDTIGILQEGSVIRRRNRLDITGRIKEFAAEHHLSPATYYRMEEKVMSSDLSKLLSACPGYRARSLCPLSEAYISHEILRPNPPFQIEILRNLEKEAVSRGADICAHCVFAPDSKEHRHWVKQYPDSEVCSRAGSGLLYPMSHNPVSRYIASISEEEKVYHQQGARAFEASVMHHITRKKEELVNHIWCADNMLADVLILLYIDDKTGRPLLARPWTCNILDWASTAVISSTVGLIPDSIMVAETFCRAAVFTMGSVFHGLCTHYYCDNGLDYRSKIMRGVDPDLGLELDAPVYPFHDICSNSLLRVLGVQTHYAKPYAGRTKLIERYQGILNQHFLRSLSGYCGSSPQDRAFDFEAEKRKALKSGTILTLPQFADLWLNKFIPAYNATAYNDSLQPDPSGKSPLQRYQELPRANTITPDWASLSVLKAHQGQYMVHADGIHYNEELYWHPSLHPFIRKRKDDKYLVDVYDFDQSFVHTLTIMYNRQYLCDAAPSIKPSVIEEDRLLMQKLWAEQNQQKAGPKQRMQIIQKSLRRSGIKLSRYARPDTIDPALFFFGEKIDEVRDEKKSDPLPASASALAEASRSTNRIIDEIRNRDARSTPLDDYFARLGEEKMKE